LLKAKFPHITDPPSDDICYATQNRQVAVKAIAERSDLVIGRGFKDGMLELKDRRSGEARDIAVSDAVREVLTETRP
ncbi:MAG: hypothetical protein ACFNLE_06020, partial [Rothia aeria]